MTTDLTTSAATDWAALDASASLAEASLHATEFVQVAQQAITVLQHHIPDLSVIFCQRQGKHLIALVVSGNVLTEADDVARAGLPTDLTVFEDTIRRRQVTFVDAWNADEQEIPEARP